MIRGTAHGTRALGGRTVDGAVGTVGGTLGQGESTRATIRPGRWLGGPEKVGRDGDARRVIVLLLDILHFQQSASLICRLSALSKKSSAVLLHSLREIVVRVELFLQLEAQRREFDCGTNSLQSLDVVLEFLSEADNGLVLLLFGDEQFAKSGDNLDKRDLIVVYPTAPLVECGQNPEDVVLACVIAIHVCESLKDSIIAPTKEGRREVDFVVLVIVRVFAVLGVFDFIHDLVLLVGRRQLGLGKLVVGARRKGGKDVFEISGT